MSELFYEEQDVAVIPSFSDDDFSDDDDDDDGDYDEDWNY